MFANSRSFISPQPRPHDGQVAGWLLLCCIMVLALVVLGGMSRMTDSGLAIIDWEPVVGFLPPNTSNDWQTLFNLYQETPAIKPDKHVMVLENFKELFWLEYIHRTVARSIGVVFLLPLLYFLALGALRGKMIRQILFLFLLGGVEETMSWIMVRSGLAADPHITPYFFTGHLMTALIIHSLLFWLALNLIYPERGKGAEGVARKSAWLFTLFITITIASGGFVAGLKAGMVYNTFPLMDDSWFPVDYFLMDSFINNLFANPIAAQFNHRLLGESAFFATLALWIFSRTWHLPSAARTAIHLLMLTTIAQVGMGIATLLLAVPIGMAAAHQVGAMVLLTISLFVTHRVTKSNEMESLRF